MRRGQHIDPDERGLPSRCAEFRTATSARFDGREVAGGAWEQHAHGCTDCREFAGGIAAARDALATLRGTPVPDLHPAIAARARTAAWRRVASSVAAAAAGAVAMWSLLAWLERSCAHADPELERALAAIGSAGASDPDAEHMNERPELRLLASLAQATKGTR